MTHDLHKKQLTSSNSVIMATVPPHNGSCVAADLVADVTSDGAPKIKKSKRQLSISGDNAGNQCK